MEWRCEWCGKPHEADDPPCDNCGHGSFEKAVVRQAPGTEGPAETTLWVCTECGRTHPKHSPPCSRCGNATLEREVRSVSDEEISAPGYTDLVTPRYVLGLAAALGLAAIFLLGVTGTVDVPGFGSDGVPEVSDVPGDGDRFGEVSLPAVEDRSADLISEELSSGETTVDRTERLDEVATYYNRRLVKAEFADGSLPDDDRILDLLDGHCGGSRRVGRVPLTVPSDSTTESGVARDVSSLALVYTSDVPAGASRMGIDVHAGPNDELFVTIFVC